MDVFVPHSQRKISKRLMKNIKNFNHILNSPREKSKMAKKIQGYIAEGYEPVMEYLDKMMNSSCEDKIQMCVYVNKTCVIDLYGSTKNDLNYNSDTMQCIFSSGKSIAAIVVAQYVEKNLLNYSEKVSKYWPEFGQNDKENITLADVLRHESGLSWLDHTFAKEDFYSENIKANKIGEIIEKCAQKFPGKTSREYHLISRGCILNEIIRRVDPQNRTIGEIIRQDPLFEGIRLGLTKEEMKNCAPLKTLSLNKIFRQSLLPKMCGRGISQNLCNFVESTFKGRKILMKNLKKQPAVEGLRHTYNDLIQYLNSEEFKKSEVPSASFHASARSLARLASMMAIQGESLEENNIENNQLMKTSTWKTMHSKTTRAFDAAHYEWRTNFSQGGINIFSMENNNNPTNGEKNLFQDRQGFIGWFGMGGSIFQWHPELKIGFAFVPTSLHWFDFDNVRGAKLQKIVIECVLKNQSNIVSK